MIVVSCGKNYHVTEYVQNPYDNSQNQLEIDALKAENLIIQQKQQLNNERITSVEVRLMALQDSINDLNNNLELSNEELQTLIDSKYQSTQNQIAFINNQFSQFNNVLNSLQAIVNNTVNPIFMIKVCSSNEHLIKVNGYYYSVYMVSNDFGTFLGKLEQNINYMTTDSSRVRFKINSQNNLQCL